MRGGCDGGEQHKQQIAFQGRLLAAVEISAGLGLPQPKSSMKVKNV
jgi:hypothetical protein